jgi:hypothetical protein
VDQAWQESQPLGAGLLVGGLGLDAAAVQAEVQSFLARLDRIGAALWNAPTGPSLFWSLLTATAAVVSCEVVRRHLYPWRRPARGATGDPLFSWYLLPEKVSAEGHP